LVQTQKAICAYSLFKDAYVLRLVAAQLTEDAILGVRKIFISIITAYIVSPLVYHILHLNAAQGKLLYFIIDPTG
jgi:hypothetical protein